MRNVSNPTPAAQPQPRPGTGPVPPAAPAPAPAPAAPAPQAGDRADGLADVRGQVQARAGAAGAVLASFPTSGGQGLLHNFLEASADAGEWVRDQAQPLVDRVREEAQPYVARAETFVREQVQPVVDEAREGIERRVQPVIDRAREFGERQIQGFLDQPAVRAFRTPMANPDAYLVARNGQRRNPPGPAAVDAPYPAAAVDARLAGADRERFRRVWDALPPAPDPHGVEARAALVQMLTTASSDASLATCEMRLPGVKSPVTSRTYLEELDALVGMEPAQLAPGLDRSQLLAGVVRETYDPTYINQDQHNACGAGAAQILLARDNPAEYVRIAAGLAAQPEGRVRTRGGMTLARRPDWDSQDGRSPSSRLLQSTFMQAMNYAGALGVEGYQYDNRNTPDGSPLDGDGMGVHIPFYGDLSVPGTVPYSQYRLLENLTGNRYSPTMDTPVVRAVLPLGGEPPTPWREAGRGNDVPMTLNWITAEGQSWEPHNVIIVGFDPATRRAEYMESNGTRGFIHEDDLRRLAIGACVPQR